ncbi:hypothetical protein VTN77DRAFT_3234 [Rasamsonia byssochlamydoides]|uniref:uncharacterized protein n=1 Tax=Rasamsonia byssochlamydoides TaxID=89139 RepID=UPI003742158B
MAPSVRNYHRQHAQSQDLLHEHEYRMYWHMANIAVVSQYWYHFYRLGWMEKLRDMPQVTTLLVEARCWSFNAVTTGELQSLDLLRKDLWRASDFLEQSARWASYFVAGRRTSWGTGPKTRLCLSLKRTDDVRPGQLSPEAPILDPLPPFEQKYTWKDCAFRTIHPYMLTQPPRSPDTNRV